MSAASGSPYPTIFQASASVTSSAKVRSSRIVATQEHIRFEAITVEDSGLYFCRSNRLSRPNSPELNEKRVHLTVLSPNIQIVPLSMGSHYAALVWNDSLKVRASDRVSLSLDVRDAESEKTSRVIRLSMQNPWYSYNVMRLKPSTVNFWNFFLENNSLFIL